MKAYTLQIGTGSGDDMGKVVFSEEVFADSLGEAIDKAKSIARIRPVHAEEDTVVILDKAHPDTSVVWARSVDDIRNG